MPRRTRTRRQFLADSGLTIAGASMASCFPDVGGRWPAESAQCSAGTSALADPTVVEIHNPAGLLLADDKRSATIQAGVTSNMVQDAVAGVAGGAAEPWRDLLPEYHDQMRIGIKVNCLNPFCPTSVPTVRALVDSLKRELGATPDQIIVWDRRGDELAACGFTEEAVGATVMGTVTSTTDSSGPGYESDYCLVNGTSTHLSRILTELTEVTINCPVLKTHNISGITAAMKNTYGIIHNPEDFHDNLRDTLPLIYNLAPIRERTRLILVDALIAVTLGDTSSQADTFPARIIAGRDPVAVDTYAFDLVNQQRAIKNDALPNSTINPIGSDITDWLDNAEATGLGSKDFVLASSFIED